MEVSEKTEERRSQIFMGLGVSLEVAEEGGLELHFFTSQGCCGGGLIDDRPFSVKLTPEKIEKIKELVKNVDNLPQGVSREELYAIFFATGEFQLFVLELVKRWTELCTFHINHNPVDGYELMSKERKKIIAQRLEDLIN